MSPTASFRTLPNLPPFSGAVLAGGRSRRFGSDKCRHPYRGRTLLEHALASLRDAEERLVVGAEAPAGSDARTVSDARPGLGPLSGLHAAVTAARHDWVAVTACDMPFLTPDLWCFLLARAEDVALVIPASRAGIEPLAGIYHRDLLPTLDAWLDRGRLSIHELAAEAPSRIVPWAEVGASFGPDTFLNANRPEELP